jgi:hypothetical protein
MLHARFDGDEPALGHHRRERLARIGIVGLHGCGVRLSRSLTVAQAAPHVELQGGVQEHRVQAAATAGLAALSRRQSYRRKERAACYRDIPRGLVDTRRRRLQVGVVRQRFGDERGQRGIVERCEPAVGDGCRRGVGCLPVCGHRCMRQRVSLEIGRRWRILERTAGHGRCEARREHPLANETCAHQCSFGTRKSVIAPMRRITMRRIWIASTCSV